MNEKELKKVNIYSFYEENYVALNDYVKLQQRIDKALELIEDIIKYPEKYNGKDNVYNLTKILKGEE